MTSFEVLFESFARRGRPLGGTGQYRWAVFLHDEAQKAAAAEFFRREGEGSPQAEGVVDGPKARFWDAEDYHQKYRLRKRRAFVAQLAQDLGADWDQYPVATALNALIGTQGDPGPWLRLLPSASWRAWGGAA